MTKKKKKRKPSAWNLFIKANAGKKKFQLPNGSPDLKAMSQAFKGKTPKKKTKSRTTTRGGLSVTTRRTTKDTVKKTRPKGEMERKMLKFKKEFNDLARAIGVPLSKTTFKFVSGTWRLKAGSVKIKRKKLTDAMKLFRKRAKALI